MPNITMKVISNQNKVLLEFFCRLMEIRPFVFYLFGECYFFSKATIGDEGFFFNNDLVPICNERGVFKQFQKYTLQKTLIPFHKPILVVAI